MAKKIKRNLVKNISKVKETISNINPFSKEDEDDDIAPVRKTASKDDIAPVKQTNTDRTWFRKGLLEDGWDAGDIAKTILGTAVEADRKLKEGFIRPAEGFVDVVPTVSSYVNKALGKDEVADKRRTFVSKNLIDEEKIARITQANPFASAANLLGVDVDEASIIGEKVEGGLMSAGQLISTMALQSYAKIPWWLTTGVTSFSSESEAAFNEGASYKEAFIRSGIAAAADILTEKIGGIKFGGKAWGTGATQLLTKNMSNKIAQNLVRAGLASNAEGFEEIIATAANRLGELLYNDEATLKEVLFSEEAFDELAESYILGLAIGSAPAAHTAANSIQTGRDSITGLTDNEQKVVDEVVKKRIAEQEAGNNKLSRNQRTAIEESVRRELEDGSIDIDTIESVLGGETLAKYKSTVEQENSLKKEIETLENTKEFDITVKQRERLAAAREQLSGLDSGALKKQLSQEVNALTANDAFLRESYNERAKRGQAFDVDLSKYKTKAQQDIALKAINSGVLNNTRRAHQLVDFIAKVASDKGIDFEFANNEKIANSGYAVEGRTTNGYKTKDGTIGINVQSSKSLDFVVGHEVTHVLEGTPLYDELQKAVKVYAETKGEYAKRLKALEKTYENAYKGETTENFKKKVEAELVADMVGEYLFTDEKFVNNLYAKNPNVFKKIYEEIKYLLKVVTAGSKEAKQLEQIKHVFEKLYKTDVKSIDKRYSLDNTESGILDSSKEDGYVRTDEFRSLQTESQRMSDEDIQLFRSGNRKIDDGLRERFSRGVKSVFLEASNNGVSYAAGVLNLSAKDAKYNIYKNVNASLFHDVFEMARKYLKFGELVDLHEIETTEEGVGYIECNNYLSDDGLSGFSITPDGDLISVFNASGKKGFLRAIAETVKKDAKTLDCYASPNQNLMEIYSTIFGFKTASIMDYNMEYDHDNIAENHGMPKVAFMVNTNANVKTKYFTENQYDDAFDYRNSFLQTSEAPSGAFFDGKTQYSLSVDSDGTPVNKNMQEHMKDSKAVDADGDLMKVYHGTVREFYTFDRSYANAEGNFGKGFYFTNNINDVDENYANEYGGDLTSKIEKEAAFLEGMEEYEDMEHDEIVEMLRKKHVTSEEPITHGCYLNIKNPCYVGRYNGNSETFLFADVYSEYDMDDFESEDDYYEAVDEAAWEYVEDAVRNVEYNTELIDGVDEIRAILQEAATGGGIRVEDLRDELDNISLRDENDEFITGEVLRLIIESQGYDGIIDSTVSSKFRGMRLSPDTVHYIVFNSNQAKLTTNENPTEKDDIRYSLSEENDVDWWLDDLSLDDLFSELLLDPTTFNSRLSDKIRRDSRETQPAKKERAKRRVDEVNKRLKEIGLSFNGTKTASWTDERIEKYLSGSYYGSSNPNYAQAYITYMTPQQFLNLTMGGKTNTLDVIQRESESYGELDFEKLGNSIPLQLDIREGRNGAKVVGHEGRHRMYLLGKAGFEKIPVLLFDYTTKYDKSYKDSLKLTAQRYNDTDLISKTRNTVVSEVIPFSQGNRDLIIQKFGSGNAADIHYSLSNEGDVDSKGRFLSKDVMFDAPIRNDIPARPTKAEATVKTNAQQDEWDEFDSIFDSETTGTVESPFEDRDIKDVGKRNVNAYMYDNPEVKELFQLEAEIMLWDLKHSTKGERIMTGSYETGQEWTGVKRATSPEIEDLLDNYNYSYADIEKGLNAIIKDHGAENIAVAKRIEFWLDERLREGYTDWTTGQQIEPNQEYIDLLKQKQAENVAPTAEDIAPIKQDVAPVENATEDIAPIREDAPKPVKGKERKWVGTSTGSAVVDGAVLPEDLDKDKITYEPIPNKKTLGNANARLDRYGYEASVVYFNSQFENKRTSLDDIALGERLIQEAINRNDTKTAGELIQNIAILGTELGQKVQALSIIKKLTPAGQLRMLEKTIERGKTKEDKAFEGVEMTQEMRDKILEAYNKDGTYDQAKLNAAVEEVKQMIAKQMKVTVGEKVNSWRYLSMLGNPKTHIRNIVSNVAMRGTLTVKNAMARTIEDIAPIKSRTKTWKPASKEVKDFAKQTAVEMKDVLKDGSKYSEETSIKAKRDIFKNKVLNAVYEFNTDMLSREDWWFSRPAFQNALKEYLTANGIQTKQDIENNPKVVEKAKAYATEQSQIATFRQYSWLANKISELEKKNLATGIAFGSVIPFKKTPVNIAKTGLNYSPLGFAKTLTYDIAEVKKGNMEASTLIDHISQNTVGSALALAGYMLAQMGILTGSGDDDEEAKYDYQLGKQSYALKLGDTTYSLSWLTPVAMPLLVGANAYEQLVEGKEWNPDVVMQTLAQTLDPMSEMSFMSSLDDVLSSYDSGVQKFAGIVTSMGQNYATQFVPTLSSQVATVMDDTKRSTKVAANSGFKMFDETINKLKYKIPGLRETLEPSTDIWGNEVKQTENMFERTFESFIAPYTRKESIATFIDDEIKDLYSQTGDSDLIPDIPKNYINYNGNKYKLSAKEYTEYKKIYGQTANDLLEDLFRNSSYQQASVEEQAKMVNEVYDYAADKAKRKLLTLWGITYSNASYNGIPLYKENSIKGAIENDMLLEEFDFKLKNPERYELLKENNVSYAAYNSSEEIKKAYDWASEHPEKYEVSKVITDDVIKYKEYSNTINDFDAKNSRGETVKGLKKTRAWNYIDSLDLNEAQKLILFKSHGFPISDNECRQVLYYLYSIDMTDEERKTTLKELDFKFKSNGEIEW